MKDGPKSRSFKKKSMISKHAGSNQKGKKTESRSKTTVHNPTRKEENQPNPRYPISINSIIVKNPACPIIQNNSKDTTRLGLFNAQISPKIAAIDSNEKTQNRIPIKHKD